MPNVRARARGSYEFGRGTAPGLDHSPDVGDGALVGQLEDDAVEAFANAMNCLLFEAEGPDLLNVGSAEEPRLLPRSEAWQHAYATRVLVSCDGDRGRLAAAAQKLREDAGNAAAGSRRQRSMSRGAELCDQAIAMVEGTGAVDDNKARRRLVAACEHEGTVIAIGVIPGVAESSAAALAETLREIDEEP
jgi:hypothetical protein